MYEEGVESRSGIKITRERERERERVRDRERERQREREREREAAVCERLLSSTGSAICNA